MIALVLAAVVLAAAPGGNDVLTKSKGPIYGVAANVRLGILAGDGRRVMQPVGFGAGLTFRVHALHVGPLRFGGMIRLGHTRFLERYTLPSGMSASAVDATRWAALGHTDFAAGPSIQIVLGRVMLEGGFGAGLGISSFVRPGPTALDEEDVSDVTGMIRGGGQLAIPIRNNQGILIGSSVQKYFSKKLVVAHDDLETPDAMPNANPFDLVVDVTLGYQMWF